MAISQLFCNTNFPFTYKFSSSKLLLVAVFALIVRCNNHVEFNNNCNHLDENNIGLLLIVCTNTLKSSCSDHNFFAFLFVYIVIFLSICIFNFLLSKMYFNIILSHLDIQSCKPHFRR